MDRLFFTLGCLSAGLAVALGAFGAHALKTRLDAGLLATFEVGVRYQMAHALALLAVAWACTRWPGGAVNASGWLFVAGTRAVLGQPVRAGPDRRALARRRHAARRRGLAGGLGLPGLGRLEFIRTGSAAAPSAP